MNLSGCVGPVTIFSWMLTISCCLVVGLGLGLDVVSGWKVVMHTYLYYCQLSSSRCRFANDVLRSGSQFSVASVSVWSIEAPAVTAWRHWRHANWLATSKPQADISTTATHVARHRYHHRCRTALLKSRQRRVKSSTVSCWPMFKNGLSCTRQYRKQTRHAKSTKYYNTIQ